ncbi:MAG: helix-turn-helix transcriptional regulator [Bacteroidota bacterium]
MKGTYLGEFEEIVLLTVAVLHEAAYGNAVKQEVEKRLDRTVNLSAIHAALYRLEEKGFLHAEMGEATKRRGGKRKKYFTITAFGLKTLETSRSIRNDLWKAIPKIVFDIK